MHRIDSHAHFDDVYDTKIVRTLLEEKIDVVSWAYVREPPEKLSEFEEYFAKQNRACELGREKGVSVWQLAGIHPRSIPKESLSAKNVSEKDIVVLLEKAIRSKYVVGIGEVGLETATPVEEAVFKIQLNFAGKHRLPVGIHTPRENKTEITNRTLSILSQCKLDADKILIDHIRSAEILHKVLDLGFYAGITVSKSKSSIEEAVCLIKEALLWDKTYADRIMLNSDLVRSSISEYDMFIDVKKHISSDATPVLGQTARLFYGLNI